MLLDARGKAWPAPMVMADDALSRLQEGFIEVLVDNEDASLGLRDLGARKGFAIVQSREGRDWKVRFERRNQ